MSKMNNCRYHHPSLHGNGKCVYGAKTLGDFDKFAHDVAETECEKCDKYKSRFIEYPITVNKIEYGDIEPWNVKPSLAKVRLCSDDKTYLGLYLGEFPHFPNASFDEESGIIKFGVSSNPCIYVPDLEKVVWGSQSWWSRIESKEELKEITDEDIDNVWYVKLLKSMEEQNE